MTTLGLERVSGWGLLNPKRNGFTAISRGPNTHYLHSRSGLKICPLLGKYTMGYDEVKGLGCGCNCGVS